MTSASSKSKKLGKPRTNRFRQLGRDIKSHVRKLAIRKETDGNAVAVYFDGDLTFGSMVAAIRDARESIVLEIYHLESDSVGWMIVEAISERAEADVEVRVLYDAVGSIGTDEAIFDRLRDAGAEVVEFRPIAPFRKGSGWLGRDHRKIVIVDQRIGFAGGMNISGEWSIRETRDNAWRDTHLRLQGPVVNDLMAVTAEVWNVATGQELDVYEPEKGQPMCGTARCLVIAGHGFGKRRKMRKLFTHELGQAQKHVQISTPYFAPVGKLMRALIRTTERGVKVELLTPDKSDIWLVDLVKQGLYRTLLKKGVRIYEYQGPMFHAKTLTLDDDRAIVGSSNFDLLSLTINREIAILIEDDKLQNALDLQFTDDLRLSREITLEDLKSRPLWKRAFSKTLSLILRCFW